LLLVSHDRDFLQGMSNLVYEFRDQKIKYLGDVNYFLEQRNLENMREVEKKDALRRQLQRIVIKLPMKNKRGKHCRIV
jgi:ATP-binding cassette subfamily F protein 3